MLKVSVITMTYNDCEHLKKCVSQVLLQDYENIEYIIVDGGSTDETLDIIANVAEKLQEKFVYISEPDKGLYDALNKGIKLATGDIVGIMCDEFATPSTISNMVQAMVEQQTDGVHGDIDYVQNGKIVRKWRMGQGQIKDGWMPGHPTLYLKKEVYENYGLYKIDYKIAADYEFMIRILKDDKVKLAYVNQVLVRMFHGENSTSTGGISNYIHSLKEGHRALVENKVRFPLLVDLRRIGRVVLQTLHKK